MHFCHLLPNSVSKGNHVFDTGKLFLNLFVPPSGKTADPGGITALFYVVLRYGQQG